MSHNELLNGAIDPVERTGQLAGNSTFVVSLPKEWALEQELDAGMSMYLYPHDDRLVAAPETVSTPERAATIDATGMDTETVVQRLTLAYTTGADRITVTGLENAETQLQRQIERTVATLIGTTIEDTADDQLVVANLLDSSEVSLPQTVAQAQQLALELHTDAIVALVTDDTDLARRVIDRDDDVDRLFAFVSRGFHRGLEDITELDQLGTDRMSAFREYRTARQLERIADHAEGIATVAMDQSGPPAQPLVDRIEAVGSDARTVIERSLGSAPEQAAETMAKVRETVTEIDQTLYDSTESDAYLYGTVIQRIRRTAEHAINIADTKIGSSVDHR